MKTIATLFLFLFSIPAFVLGQIPNSGFETWASGEPADWMTSNIPSIVTNVTQSATANSGSSALRGEVVDVSGNPFSPIVMSMGNGFPVSQRHASLTGYYQLSTAGGDVAEFSVLMFKDGAIVGGGGEVFGPAASYTQFSLPIFYTPADVPDTCYIIMAIADTSADGTPTVGSFMLVDDLAFSGIVTAVPTAENVPHEFDLKQNYPNPFNPGTNFEFSLPKDGFASLKIYDLLGREVANVFSGELGAGTHKVGWNAEGLSAGVYFYELNAAGGFRMIRKLILAK